MNIRKTLLTGGLGAVLAGGGLLALTTAVEATAPAPDHKVTICHATGSASNPYVTETVDVASIESFVNGTGHGSSGVNAGDIIPPFTYAPDNFSFAGQGNQSILANGCHVVATPTPPATTVPTPTPPATTVPTPTPPATTVPTPTPSPTATPRAATVVPNNSTPTGAAGVASSTATGEPLAATGFNDNGFLIGLLLLVLGFLVMAATAIRVRRSER